MGLFGKKTNKVRADTADSYEPMTDDMLLSAILGQKKITREETKKIPTVTACLDFIAGTLDSLPIRLYQKTEQGIEIVKDDVRVNLLNQDTGDTLTAKQFWRAILEDYYLGSGGYAYIERAGTRIRSIRYVEDSKVTVIKNEHPIFKDYDIYVYDNKYYPFEFLKFLRKTTDGCTSCSIVEENDLIFGVSYNTLIYQENLVKKGGNKRGFLKSKRKLSEEAMTKLKDSFRRLYSNNRENVIVLNDGLEFEEASNTSVEMQMNENKETDSTQITGLFKVPYSLLTGKGITKEDRESFIKFCITPLLADFECSLNRDLLLESEKSSRYFAFDTKELTRGNIEERYKAYEVGLRNNFLQVDEVREKEDYEPLGINWIRLGLDSVLYDPKTNMIYTPNTNEMKQLKGVPLKKEGKDNESGVEK